MEKNFNNRDFEQFVKQNADQYRMFPSEKVWKNIHHTLHTRRRWFGIGLALLMLTAGTVTWVMLSPSSKNNPPLTYKQDLISPDKTPDQKNNPAPALIALAKPTLKTSPFVTTAGNLQRNLFLSGLTDNQDNNPAAENNIAPVSSGMNEKTAIPNASVQVDVSARPSILNNKQLLAEKTVINNSSLREKNSDIVLTEKKNQDLSLADKKITVENKDNYPLSIESVVNSYKHTRNKKRLSWEVFFAPTVSYRKLDENKAFINSAQLNNNTSTSFTGINSLVTHKPDMGLQLGFNTGYPLTKNMKIIGGLQFNVSQYDIRAYFSASEVATISLNSGSGSNSVSTSTNYRNFNGGKADWLRNLYFSVSAPVGIELKLTGNKKTELGISGTIQPSYILSDRAYVISTDYKNYANVPSLTRRWNMSTSFEVFAGYSTGKINWRVGPLVRYQLQSSFVDKYPIKEHLFDFGLKLGIMLKK